MKVARPAYAEKISAEEPESPPRLFRSASLHVPISRHLLMLSVDPCIERRTGGTGRGPPFRRQSNTTDIQRFYEAETPDARRDNAAAEPKVWVKCSSAYPLTSKAQVLEVRRQIRIHMAGLTAGSTGLVVWWPFFPVVASTWSED